jgi:hypothetical protein
MAKQLLNEADRYLREHWADARLLEKSMEDVRSKYKEVFERIAAAVSEVHPELDARRIAVTQFWGKGHIGFGRKSWPGGETSWPSGLWVDNLRLEVLAAEDSEPPYAHIWVPMNSKANIDYHAARAAVKNAAKDLLSPEVLQRTIGPESFEDVLFCLPAPSKRELLCALADGDGQGFVELFVSQFELMARFVPVLDKVFCECLTKD